MDTTPVTFKCFSKTTQYALATDKSVLGKNHFTVIHDDGFRHPSSPRNVVRLGRGKQGGFAAF